MPVLRSDAARNRERILDAARGHAERGEPLALNAVARDAGVGVATVYRHFATVEELEEALVWDRFDDLAHVLDEAEGGRLDTALTRHFELLVDDALFERVTARAVPSLPETATRRDALVSRLDSLMGSATGRLRPGIGAEDVLLLLCGLAHSVRGAGLPADAPRARRLLGVTLAGMRAGPAGADRTGS